MRHRPSCGSRAMCWCFPTVPGQIAGAMAAVTQLLAKLEKLPLDRMGESLEATFQGVNQIVNGAELKQSLAALQATLAGTQELVKRLDEGIAPSPAAVAGHRRPACRER